MESKQISGSGKISSSKIERVKCGGLEMVCIIDVCVGGNLRIVCGPKRNGRVVDVERLF
jgi:hypothetical protein